VEPLIAEQLKKNVESRAFDGKLIHPPIA